MVYELPLEKEKTAMNAKDETLPGGNTVLVEITTASRGSR